MRWMLVVCWLMAGKVWALEIPKNLSASDRLEVMRILGLSTSSKTLSNPYPLGGYSGLEFGLSMEVINTADLSRLGDKTTLEQEFRFPRVTVGKGLFYDVDLFLHFTPYSEDSDISEYGGLVRWSFFEARFLPVNFSLLVHGNNININDQFNNQTLGLEIVCGINTSDFALYFGAGQLNATGEFLSGDTANPDNQGIVDPSDPGVGKKTLTVKESLKANHSFIGFSLHFDNVFAAAQIDRYDDVVYSAKLGMRF